MRKMTMLCLLAALLMMGLGLWRGEGGTVLSKGINLCMECVGIGGTVLSKGINLCMECVGIG